MLVTTFVEAAQAQTTNLKERILQSFDLERVALHEYEFPITEDNLDVLDAAIAHATSTPLVTKLTVVTTPQLAMNYKELLWSRGFQVSGSRTKDCKILMTFALIVKRSQDGGASPLTIPKSAHEQQAIAEQVQRCDATLSKFGAR